MKVTQKEFVSAMTNNLTYFAGRTRKMLERDEIECALADILDPDKRGFLEMRSCRARSGFLEFGENGSRYDLTGNKFGKYEYEHADVYYAQSLYDYDSFSGEYKNGDIWVVCWYVVFK